MFSIFKCNVSLRAPLILILLIFTSPSWGTLALAEQWQGVVVYVQDGDSLKIDVDGQTKTIRLKGIDSPEKDQPYGNEARVFVQQLVQGKEVAVEDLGLDKYQRTLATVTLANGVNLNEEIVRAGLAWHFKQYSQDPELARLEQEARQNQRGLWADPNPTSPWVWRHNDRK